MDMQNSSFSDQVRLAVMAADAAWCAGLETRSGSWTPVSVWGHGREDEIAALTEDEAVRGWLDGAIASGRVRTRQLADAISAPTCRRITVFPAPGGGHALLVGTPSDRIDPDSRAIFKSLSRRAAGQGSLDALEHAAQAEDSARAEFMRVAEQIGGLDITELDLEGVLRRSVERSRELVGGTAGELGLIDQRNGTVRVLWSELRGAEKPYAVPMGEDLIGRVAAEGRPLVVEDYHNWPDRSLENGQAGALVGVPLKYKDSLIGALAVADRDPARKFSNDDVRMLEMLATQVSISIRNARLFQELGDRIRAQRAAEGRIAEAARLAAIGEMAASIAHELNNPLTTINGFTELLMRDFPEGSRQRENMGLVLSEARRAREVVRRLLDFSRREPHLKGPVNVTDMISEVLALAGPMAQNQQVEIQFEAWEDLPPVFGDKSQLSQVLMNLVTNAIQAMPGGGVLFIRTALQEKPRRMVTVRVRDTGTGIPHEYLEQVFDPFFTTKPVGAGTGLGLSISRNIVSEHGGDIRVESESEGGSCFIVKLPLAGAE